MKKKVMLVTSCRADWGLLRPLARRIRDSDRLSLCLAVTGAHLRREYGNTLREIIRDGFSPDETADILKYGDSERGNALTMAGAIEAFSGIISRQKPDLARLLGDRYEIFAVAAAACAMSVPVAHISGGDVTAGAKDDFYRHCITKMASLHFPSCADSAKRIIQLGEEPDRVFNFGGLGNENLKTAPLLSLPRLEESLGLGPLAPFALVTVHPETRTGADGAAMARNLLSALDRTGLKIIVTGSNADRGGRAINDFREKWCRQRPGRAAFFMSLGMRRYHSALKYARLEAGNSSSGVVETPVFGTPAVNIGERQLGRYTPGNVINCPDTPGRIEARVKKALSDDFLKVCRKAENPYDAGVRTSRRIAGKIADFLEKPQKIKRFYDVDFALPGKDCRGRETPGFV